MKKTLQDYEKAKKGLQKAKAYQETVKAWESALKTIGDTGNQKVVAVTIKDGKIVKIECELDETADRPILKAAKGA